MPNLSYKVNFLKGVNLDAHPLRIDELEAVFIKNMTANSNANTTTNSGAGGTGAGANMGIYTPLEGNKELYITGLPSGSNYCIGYYSSEQTNEGYAFIYNSGGNHCVLIIRGDSGGVQICYGSTLLPFSLNPANFITDGRCTLYVYSYIDPTTGNENKRKELVFTTGENPQCYIGDVEASIATDFWTNPASSGQRFYNPTTSFYNPLELLHLGVPTPLDQITVVGQSPISTNQYNQNLLLNNGWQFRIKTIDVFGRESLHGIISAQYLPNTGGGCIANSTGQPSCLEITFDTGNAFVDQIQIEYRKWTGNDRGGAIASNWLLCETINKWTSTSGVEWWNQDINTTYGTSGSNTFTYIFCANKQSIPLPNDETALVTPGLPLTSSTIAAVGNANALGNNTYGFQPIDVAEMKKITVQPVLPSNTVCTPQTRSITIYANIWNPVTDESSWIRKGSGKYLFGNGAHAAGNDTIFGDQTNPGFIGVLVGNGTIYTLSKWGNLNVGAASGGYLTGTGVFTEVNIDTENTSDFPQLPVVQFTFNNVPAGKYLFYIVSHKGVMGDPTLLHTSTYTCGVIEFQTRFQAAPATGNAMAGYTSTNSFGYVKEVEIDCTSSDIVYNGQSNGLGGAATNPLFLIMDVTLLENFMAGYVVEDNGSGQNTPVEMLPVVFMGLSGLGTSSTSYGSFYTDRNGFYFGMRYLQIEWNGCDGLGAQSLIVYNRTRGTMLYGNNTIDPPTVGGLPNWRARTPLYTTKVFPACGRIITTQTIYLCPTTTIGVPGVPVVMTKSSLAITDFSGNAVLISHNRYNYQTSYPSGSYLPPFATYVPDYSTGSLANDYLIISQGGGCTWTTCSGCTPSVADVLVTYQVCQGTGCTNPRVNNSSSSSPYTIPNIYVLVGANNISGLQSGGRYAVTVTFEDVIGRQTFAQPIAGVSASSLTSGEAGIVVVPTLNYTSGSPATTDLNFQLYNLQFTIGSGFQVPSEFVKMTFGVSRNLNFSDYIDWCADLVQYVDNTGSTNAVTPTYIRFYYGSLNEYNKNYSFQTVTNWQFIAVDVNGQQIQGQTVEGDICQIIANGNGTPIQQGIQTPVIYDQSGLFFSIEYNPSLAGLTTGTLFRIIRPNPNQSEINEPYYEQCFTIELSSGIPVSANGSSISLPYSSTLPYVDSYIVNRLFPVPIPKGLTTAPAAGSAFPPLSVLSINNLPVPAQGLTLTQTTYNQNNLFTNGIVEFDATLGDSSVSYGFFWESNAPSDFWGKGIFSAGRINYVNPFEAQIRKGNEIAVSDPISGRPNGLNGVGYFQDINKTTFDQQTWGNIVIMLVETSMVLVICEVDHFITYFNQTQLNVNLLGQVSSRNPEGSLFQAPTPKVGQNFGCRFNELNTIKRWQGKVVWLDVKKGLILSNFESAINISERNSYQGWLLNKISYMNYKNQSPDANGTIVPIGGIDPKTNEYYLTFFLYPPSGSPSYINTQSQPEVNASETAIIDLIGNQEQGIQLGRLKGFASFTPEYFGMLPGWWKEKQFISFKGGQPYLHHFNDILGGAPLFANFYGTQCECRVTVICNPNAEKVKRYLYTELYTSQSIVTGSSSFNAPLFYSDNITTEKGQLSRLNPKVWTLRNNFQCSAILCDLNTPYDPNQIPQTTTNKLWDGNQLQGRWLLISYKTNDSVVSGGTAYVGTYFEISAATIAVNGVEKSGD